jgi:hypothetical protein
MWGERAVKPGPFARRKCPKAAGKLTQSGFGVYLHKRENLINKTHDEARTCAVFY